MNLPLLSQSTLLLVDFLASLKNLNNLLKKYITARFSFYLNYYKDNISFVNILVQKVADLRFPTYRFDNSAQGKFMLSIAFGQSKYYIDNFSENVKRGIREKLRRGEWPGIAPVGYLNDYKLHTIYPDPEKAPFIRKMFELYASENYTLESMTQEVNRWGLIGGRGKLVCKAQLARMLRNPIYYGVFKYRSELYEGSHPPLISI